MALPPDSLETYIDLHASSPKRLPYPHTLAAFEACLNGWAHHRHFVAGDEDRFAKAFFDGFGDYVCARLGQPAPQGWGALLDSLGDTQTAHARFFDLVTDFEVDQTAAAAAAVRDLPAHLRPPPEPEPPRPDLVIYLQKLIERKDLRPGDGGIAALESHIKGWIAHRRAGEPDRDDGATAVQIYFDDWLAQQSQTKGHWADQIAVLCGIDEDPYACVLRMVAGLQQRRRDVIDKWHPEFGAPVIG